MSRCARSCRLRPSIESFALARDIGLKGDPQGPVLKKLGPRSEGKMLCGQPLVCAINITWRQVFSVFQKVKTSAVSNSVKYFLGHGGQFALVFCGLFRRTLRSIYHPIGDETADHGIAVEQFHTHGARKSSCAAGPAAPRNGPRGSQATLGLPETGHRLAFALIVSLGRRPMTRRCPSTKRPTSRPREARQPPPPARQLSTGHRRRPLHSRATSPSARRQIWCALTKGKRP